VLFSKYSGMGDIICTFPAVHELMKRHPRAPVIYNCHSAYACLPRMGGITERVTHLRQVGVLHHWYRWLFAGFYQFPSADESPDDFCKDYVVKEYARLHGVPESDAHPPLKIDPAVTARVQQKLSALVPPGADIVTIQTGPTWAIREWPVQAWAELIKELQAQTSVTVVHIGSAQHLSVGVKDLPALPGVVSLVDALTLEESCAAIAASRLFIGIDSGLLHVAAALSVPCVGIFGPTSPQLRLPVGDVQNCVVSRIECQGCHHRVPRIHWESGCPYEIACMKTLPTAEVLRACRRLLQSNLTTSNS